VRTFKWVPQVTPEYWVRSGELASCHFPCTQNSEVVSKFWKICCPLIKRRFSENWCLPTHFFYFATGLKSTQLRGRSLYSLGHRPLIPTEQDVDWRSEHAWTLRSVQISITLAGSRIPISCPPTEAQSHFYKHNTAIRIKFTRLLGVLFKIQCDSKR